MILNLGCADFKLPGFTNIDLNESCNPDIILDAKLLDTKFKPETVDFIHAGHFFEHFIPEDSLSIMKQCHKCLKKYGTLMMTVPDFDKCINLPIQERDRILLANGDHKMFFTVERAINMLKSAGFKVVTEIKELSQIPYIIVPDIKNPIPEPWQSSFHALKIF